MSTPRVLPSSVRFASEHKGCQLGHEEIRDLLNGGFVDEVIPLVLEALASDADALENFLDEIVRCIGNYDSDAAIGTIIRETLEILPLNSRVPAHQLIEMSWCGFVQRQKIETHAAVSLAEARVPILVGYSSAVALVPLIRHGAPFYLMLPNGDGDMSGYEFYPTSEGTKVFLTDGTDIGEEKISLMCFPDRFGCQQAEVLKIDLESSRLCNVVLESVFGV